MQRLQLALDAGDVLEERQRILHGHVQHLGDVLPPIGDLKGLTIVALPIADLARHIDIRQEVHLDLDLTVTLARFAATMCMIETVRERRRQRIGDKGALPRTGNAGNDGERAQRNLQGHILQVVLGGARHLQLASARMASLGRHRDGLAPRKVVSCERTVRGHHLLRRAGGDDLPTMLARTRSHVHHEIGRADGVLVMLHHDDGIAQVAQVFQRGDQALVIALMKADGRFVQDIEHAHQSGTDLGGKADALRFAARERGRGALQGKVVQTHIHQEA